MNCKCPHCGTEYEVEEGDIGKYTNCLSCGKGFVVKRKGSLGRKVVSQYSGKDPVLGSDGKDVKFVAPLILTILQYLQYVAVILVGRKWFCYFMKIEEFDIAAQIVIAMLAALLSIRLEYEFFLAIFEGVRHLREVRDKLR